MNALLRKIGLKVPGLPLVLLLCAWSAVGQNAPTLVAGIPVNYDEAKVPAYTLPDPLVLQNGKKVESAQTWHQKRRPEILSLFESEQFGKTPERKKARFPVFEKGTLVFNDKAIRKQITIYFTEDTAHYKADLLLYLPAQAEKPAPVLLQIGFSPNSLAVNDPDIRKGLMWNREGKQVPDSTGRRFGSFDVEKFIVNGIGVATIYYGAIEPDFPQGIKYGIRGHYLKPGTTYPAPDEWGTISAWAWGLSHVMDYLETDQQVDSEKVALYGVSRLGKTVLWAGAQDQRFGMVIASCSGEGGAALSRRQYGETIKHMTDSTRYFYQFSGNRAHYGDAPESSPVDGHMLISLIAPRPLLLLTGDTDNWSDPKGEFAAAVAAGPVYKLLGKKGLETTVWPAAGKPILHDLGYYMHAGGHGTLPADFDIILDFIRMHFMKK
ncbi:alpha/beta hydrolase family protein [Salmonirosea aquatica]|uniref:Acetylxylan esterase n=1 Tax=Salmonirosea aquatica TaxID=2654236 RepID=A0A7C9FX07_9BACT|nr:acetylxylan esterase [Cytophagaceae bacterium SJW1-29]